MMRSRLPPRDSAVSTVDGLVEEAVAWGVKRVLCNRISNATQIPLLFTLTTGSM